MKPGVNRMNRLSYSLKILFVLFILNGCFAGRNVTAPQAASTEALNGASGSSQETTDLERLGRLWQTRTQQTSVSDYPIGPGDLLEVSVPLMEEIKDRAVRVTAEGTISLPFIGRVQAAGLTEAELAEQLRPRLKDYLRNPRVFIFVREYNSRQVAVLGAVTKPGLYNLTSGSENILDMISCAGGVLP